VNDEQRLIEKLRRIEALFAGTTEEGERAAAASALERLLARLAEVRKADPPVEYRFSVGNEWSRRLLMALLRRYGIEPYRYYRQRYTTVMARVPQSFVDDTLWPQFEELNETLRTYLSEVTSRVIRESIFDDDSEAAVKDAPRLQG